MPTVPISNREGRDAQAVEERKALSVHASQRAAHPREPASAAGESLSAPRPSCCNRSRWAQGDAQLLAATHRQHGPRCSRVAGTASRCCGLTAWPRHTREEPAHAGRASAAAACRAPGYHWGGRQGQVVVGPPDPLHVAKRDAQPLVQGSTHHRPAAPRSWLRRGKASCSRTRCSRRGQALGQGRLVQVVERRAQNLQCVLGVRRRKIRQRSSADAKASASCMGRWSRHFDVEDGEVEAWPGRGLRAHRRLPRPRRHPDAPPAADATWRVRPVRHRPPALSTRSATPALQRAPCAPSSQRCSAPRRRNSCAVARAGC